MDVLNALNFDVDNLALDLILLGALAVGFRDHDIYLDEKPKFSGRISVTPEDVDFNPARGNGALSSCCCALSYLADETWKAETSLLRKLNTHIHNSRSHFRADNMIHHNFNEAADVNGIDSMLFTLKYIKS